MVLLLRKNESSLLSISMTMFLRRFQNTDPLLCVLSVTIESGRETMKHRNCTLPEDIKLDVEVIGSYLHSVW
jgi:hypothetical protein